MTAHFFSKTATPEPAGISSTPAPLLQDARNDFGVVFIHSRLDDYGLTPQQFRVYAHLARRAGSGAAFPAVKTIAGNCQLHPQTVRQSLRVLVQHRLITREPRPGTTPIYRLTPASGWQPPTRITGIPSESDPPPSVSEPTPAKRIQGHPYETNGAEGNPLEGNPKKAIQGPHSPPSGERGIAASSLLSHQAEEIYAAYPKKVGKPTALRAIRRAISRHTFEIVKERTRLYAQTYNGPADYVPNPSTFFNQDRFNDDPATWRRTARPGSNGAAVPPRKFDAANYKQPLEKF